MARRDDALARRGRGRELGLEPRELRLGHARVPVHRVRRARRLEAPEPRARGVRLGRAGRVAVDGDFGGVEHDQAPAGREGRGVVAGAALGQPERAREVAPRHGEVVVAKRVAHRGHAGRLEARQLLGHGREVGGGARGVVGSARVAIHHVAEAHGGDERARGVGRDVRRGEAVDGAREREGDRAVMARAALKVGVVLFWMAAGVCLIELSLAGRRCGGRGAGAEKE